MLRKSSSKSALTASVISLALCFVMLLGTTFAWWSTSTSSTVNTVKAGNLTIDLIDSNDEDGATLVGKKLDFINEEGEVIEDALWEPGCSYSVQDVYLKNTGSVNIKYKINVIGIDGDEGLAEVIEWKVNGQDATVFEGTLESGATSDVIKLTGKMSESAGNQYMNKTADGIAVAVYATQEGATEFEEVVALIQELDETPEVTPSNGPAVTLDTAYSFTPVAGAPEEKYASWNADYVVSFNQDVDAGAVCLAGQYEAWENGAWVGFYNDEAIAAGEEIRLLESSQGRYVNYQECCDLVKEFKCGAASDVSGLSMTVELRLFETIDGVETGEYVTACTYTYTF